MRNLNLVFLAGVIFYNKVIVFGEVPNITKRKTSKCFTYKKNVYL
jgi:hypothetical protein